MKTNVFKIRNLIPLFLTVAVFLSVYLLMNQKTLNNKLSEEKVKSENLLSEKLKLDKSVASFQKELSAMKGKNSQLDNMIAEANLKILSKSQEIEKLIRQNASIPELKKKITELENLKNQLTGEIPGLNAQIAQLKNENKQLSDKLTIAINSNDKLISDNSVLKGMMSDNYRTEALKGKNEKLTINARRTNKLLVSFDIPSNLGNNVYFMVKTPDGQEFSSKTDQSASVEITENGDALLAGATKFVAGAGTKRVAMSYHPLKKLARGIYEFNVYNDGNYIGSTQLRLK